MTVRPRLRVSNPREMEALLLGLALQSWCQLTGPERSAIPPLYSGHYRYRMERPGREDWQSALENARRGIGDCEDLATHRVAELWRDGVRGARPKILQVSPNLFHVVVAHPDGTIEDPSRRLGMKGPG